MTRVLPSNVIQGLDSLKSKIQLNLELCYKEENTDLDIIHRIYCLYLYILLQTSHSNMIIHIALIYYRQYTLKEQDKI